MKIKNLAFYGVMAAILGSVGTARADDSTIIASKGYVDAYAQKDADRVRTTWTATSSDDKASTAKYPSMATLQEALTTVEGSIQSVENNALAVPAADNPKLTKVSAIKGMVTTSGETAGVRNNNLNAVDNASDQKVPSEKAVAVELGLKENHADTVPVLQTGQTAFTVIDGGQSVGNNLGRLDAAIKDNEQIQSDWNQTDTTAKDFIKNKPTVDQTYSATSTNAQSGTAVAGAISGKEDVSNKKNATTAAEWNTLTAAATKSTDYTTVQAVENALTTITGDYEQNNVVTSANPNKATKVTAVQKGTFYMNGADIGSRTANVDINAVNSYVNTALAQGGPGVKWGVEGLTGTDASKMDDYIPTVAAVEARFKAQDKHNEDHYVEEHGITGFTGSNVHSIVKYNDDGLVIGGVDLDNTLNNINVANGGSANANECSAANPCVLSYIGGNTYKWTQMATEGLSAVADATSGS